MRPPDADVEVIAAYAGVGVDKVRAILSLGEMGDTERGKLVATVRRLRREVRSLRGQLKMCRDADADLRNKYLNLQRRYDAQFRAPHELIGVDLA